MNYSIILQGVSGSGKSAWARKHERPGEVVSADDYFTNWGLNPYHFKPDKLGQAHAMCLRAYLLALENGADVIVDNTNTTIAEIAPYYALAQAFDYQVEIVSLDVDLEAAIKRNVHNVPEATIRAQDYRIAAFRRFLPQRWNYRKVKV